MADNSKVAVGILIIVILIMGGYIMYGQMMDSRKEYYKKGVEDGKTKMAAEMFSQLDGQGFITQSFNTKNGTITLTLTTVPTQQQLQQIINQQNAVAYQQGMQQGQVAIATDMFNQLKDQGFIQYNFTDGKTVLPLKLNPEQV